VILERELAYFAHNGLFMLNDWQITAKPEENVTIILKTDAIELDKAEKAKDNKTYNDMINL